MSGRVDSAQAFRKLSQGDMMSRVRKDFDEMMVR